MFGKSGKCQLQSCKRCRQKALRNQLIMGVALGGLLIAGYGRQAGAGDCVDNGGFNFTCSGAPDPATDKQQSLGEGIGPVVVTADPTFGIDVTTAGADAFSIVSNGGLKFTQAGTNPITGASSGIVAKNTGGGELSITASTVTGTSSKGIYAFNGGGTDLTISAGSVAGGTDGVFANNFGFGALSITATGQVTAAGGSGILAINAGTDLTISAFAVEGGGNGITADNSYGKGALSITAYGPVTGATGNGISAINAGAGGLTISGLTVAGGADGVNAKNLGGGALSITVTDVTGTSGNGVYALNAGTDLTVSTKNVSGGTDGIYANNTGSGATSIKATGPVYGLNSGSGIAAKHAGSGNLTISSSAVFGDTNGIDGYNSGSGALSITSDGSVTGKTGSGITAFNTTAGTELTISATSVSGGQNGIVVQNYGAGPVKIDTTGPVTGGTDNGIYAFSYSGGLTISAADVSGGSDGISTRNFKGSLSLTASGTVSGISGSGIKASNYSGDYVTITAATVVGNKFGIDVYNVQGDLSITVTDSVTGNGNYGIRASNIGGSSTTIALLSGATVEGAAGGIYALNQYGPLSITGSGMVTGSKGNGIYAVNDGTDLTIEASTVSGSENGINAKNTGAGSLSITITDTVTGTGGSGILAKNSSGGDVTISVASAVGDAYGIDAYSASSGDMSITVTDSVTGNGKYGIKADNKVGDDLSIALSKGATVYGATGGVFAFTQNGALSITGAGTITGNSGDGINAVNTGTDLTIEAAAVSGSENGINAKNTGTGFLSITVTDAVTGTGGSGIVARNYAGGDVTISVASVVGNKYGIDAYGDGSGDMSITVTDSVTGNGQYGIKADNKGGDDLSIALSKGATVDGATGGVFAFTQNGALSITGAGTITGSNGNGINAVTAGTDLTIEAAAVSGSENGINAKNTGTGFLSITVTDAVTGTGGSGIVAKSYSGGDVTISAAKVVGDVYGIDAYSDSSGKMSITVTDGVTGNGKYGINAYNKGGADLSITLSKGATVEGAYGGVFANHVGSSGNFIATNNGIIRSLSQSPGDLAFKAVSDLVGMQIINGSSGTILGRIEATAMGDSFNNTGLWTNTGTSDFAGGSDTLNNLAGATIRVADDSAADETATWAGLETFNHVEGLLTFADGNAGDQLTTSGDFNGGGTIAIDVNFVADTADMFNIGGSVAGSPTGVTVDAVGGVVQDTGDPGIAVITVDGNTADGDFFVTQQLGIYSYTLSLDDGVGTWYVRPELAPGPFGGVNIVDPAFVFLSVQPAALNLGRDLIGTLWERVGLREIGHGANGVSDGSDRDAFGTWFRVSGSWIDGDGAIETSSGAPDASYDTDQWFVQGGIDGRLYQGTDGQLIGGVFAHWATSDTNADALDGSDAGTVDMDAYGGGASLTWYGANGLYADALAQATAYQVDMSAREEGALGSPDGWGFGTSLEVGYSAEIAPGFSLVPQAQLVYQSVSFDDFTDQLGNTVVWDTSESLEGRFGLAVETGDRGVSGTGWSAYADANLIHDFFDTEGVSISGDDIEFDRSPTSVEVGGGINLLAIEGAVGINLYLDGDYRFPIDGDGVTVVQATAGVRVNW